MLSIRSTGYSLLDKRCVCVCLFFFLHCTYNFFPSFLRHGKMNVLKRTNNESNMQNSGNLNCGNHRATWQNQQRQHWPKCKDWQINMQLHLHVNTCTFVVSSLVRIHFIRCFTIQWIFFSTSFLLYCTFHFLFPSLSLFLCFFSYFFLFICWLYEFFLSLYFFFWWVWGETKQNLFACLVVGYQFARKTNRVGQPMSMHKLVFSTAQLHLCFVVIFSSLSRFYFYFSSFSSRSKENAIANDWCNT